jgi:flagellar biosynthesis/type III secretory pathway M-ring protein FliF/YscJ
MPNVPSIALENTTTTALENAIALGAVQKKSLEQVGDLIKDKPEEALAVLRGWLNTPAKA